MVDGRLGCAYALRASITRSPHASLPCTCAKLSRQPPSSLRQHNPDSLSASSTDQSFTQTNAPSQHCPPRVLQHFHVKTQVSANTSQSGQCAPTKDMLTIHSQGPVNMACLLVSLNTKNKRLPAHAISSTPIWLYRDCKPTSCPP